MTPASPVYLRLKSFFEEREVSRRAVAPLSDRAALRLRLTGHGGEYLFTAHRGQPRLDPYAGEPVDLTITVPDAAAERLVSLTDETLSAYALCILEMAASDDPAIKVRGNIHSGVWTLWRHGYFGLLRLGGPPMMEFLKRKGLGSLTAIRQKIRSTRRPLE
ncbi:MAG: hypothetical protein KIT79_15570 [Deltaproteobacteria bacterium]|nr:hypothetical protein [Deltaproteobacteria bacterium]